MENTENKQTPYARSRILFVIGAFLTGIITLVILYLTHKAVPFMMDDLWYSTRLYDEEPVRSLKDVADAQIWHYNNWGGRSMTHGLLQLLLMAGETFADLCNVAVTVLLSFLLYLVAAGERPVGSLFSDGHDTTSRTVLWIWLLTLGTGFLIGLNANWKMSMFWQAGAANYLYITVFLLLFLFVYLRELGENVPRSLPGITVWILPLGLVSGWSNENMGPTLWLVSVFTILHIRKKGRRIPLWTILGSATVLLGSLLCILAPGNRIRAVEAETGIGPLWKMFLRGYAESTAVFSFLFPTLVITVFLLIMTFITGLKLRLQDLVLLCAALLSWGAFLLSPHYPDRATFGTMVLLICANLSMADGILKKEKKGRMGFFLLALLIWLRAMYVLFEFLSISWGWIR